METISILINVRMTEKLTINMYYIILRCHDERIKLEGG
jgi:hypothetical protein